MKEVTKDQYWKFIKHKDAVLEVITGYPYTVNWSMRGSRVLIAKSVDSHQKGKAWPLITKYYILISN